MPPQTSTQGGVIEDMRTGANVLAFLTGTLARFGHITFFRSGFGSRYLDSLQTLAVVPLILLFSLFWTDHDCGGLVLALVLYLIRCVYHRISAIKQNLRTDRGERTPALHTRYDGQPTLAKRFPRLSESAIKDRVEPLVMGAMGICSMVASPPLGWFMVWTALGMTATNSLINRHLTVQVMDLCDASIETQQLAERFRQIQSASVRTARSSK